MSDSKIELPRSASPSARFGVPPLSIHNLQDISGGAIEAVRDLSLEVLVDRIVALPGSYRTGKSTLPNTRRVK